MAHDKKALHEAKIKAAAIMLVALHDEHHAKHSQKKKVKVKGKLAND